MRQKHPGIVAVLLGDGRPLLTFTGLCLILYGMFALFLAATGQFPPHEVEFLGMTPAALCAINECRIVHFMHHDRASFGAALFAIGLLYIWLAEFPLRQRQLWAWQVFVVSGTLGFGSFLAYLSYGYLDVWHGTATLALFPCFVVGLARSYALLPRPVAWWSLPRPATTIRWRSAAGIGRMCLLAAAGAMSVGGLTILLIGATSVLVPQDVSFLGLSVAELRALNPRLPALIAHDRAGFGGAVCTFGFTMLACVWCGRPARGLWQVLALSGIVGFGMAIGVHPVIGYTDPIHLAPAVAGAVVYAVGMILTCRRMLGTRTVRPVETHRVCPVNRPGRWAGSAS